MQQPTRKPPPVIDCCWPGRQVRCQGRLQSLDLAIGERPDFEASAHHPAPIRKIPSTYRDDADLSVADSGGLNSRWGKRLSADLPV